MSKWLLTIFILVLGGALVATEADARRLGAARSSGVQRSQVAPPPSSTTRPAQQQATPGQQQAAPAQGAPGQPAPAASGLSRWLPMLGGLAIGGLLGSLFAGSGLGGILLLVLLAIAAVMVFRAIARRRAPEASRPMQYAGMGGERVVARPPEPVPGSAAAPSKPAAQAAGVPANFDSTGFLRGAKMNFVKLQGANDLGNLDEIREFTTPEMFDVLEKDVAERRQSGEPQQQTDVHNLDAELLEVATEGDKHWASVRFSGMVRETPGTAPVGFEEVWNLVKPTNGSSGWLLAGIQQMH